jgi:hypothetical protein
MAALTPAKKDRLTVADRFLSPRRTFNDRLFHPLALAQVKRSVAAAHRFVFDEDACRRVAKVVLDIPELLVREHQFARAPFELTWIEWPSWHYWMELRKDDPPRYDRAGGWGNPETADFEVGYLIDHGRINVVSAGMGPKDLNAEPMLIPLQYRLNTEWDLYAKEEFARRVGLPIFGLDAYLWGSTWDDLAEHEREDLVSLNTAEFLPFSKNADPSLQEEGGMAAHLRGSVGDLRTIIALLLILNRPSLTTYVDVGHRGKTFNRGKLLPLLSHTRVTVSLDLTPTLRLLGTSGGDSVQRRRHEVRNYYKENREARDMARIAGCVHEYIPTNADWEADLATPTDQIKHWVCSECGGKRWWVRKHHRGNEELGHVHHDAYDVVSRSR